MIARFPLSIFVAGLILSVLLTACIGYGVSGQYPRWAFAGDVVALIPFLTVIFAAGFIPSVLLALAVSMRLARASKIVFSTGVILSAFVAAFLGYAAMMHDPQWEYSGDLAHFAGFLGLNFGIALCPFVILTTIVELFCRYRSPNPPVKEPMDAH
ncbi:hypothetical protein HH303_12090 [Rhodospirillaceae bacterium KN72]|uniref:Uncharacterized protein n=1 Tax=Pacificispira spongiicola TaxID=2729598 RepID=A0A7Y0E0Z2_9PROT|nr:hypothetical protein [Pacificispira spongiicola]NMM45224.1 hypothetical protein [Pacificispira spongiicola]